MSDNYARVLRFYARDHKPNTRNSFAEIHTKTLLNAADRIEELEATIDRFNIAISDGSELDENIKQDQVALKKSYRILRSLLDENQVVTKDEISEVMECLMRRISDD